MQKKTAARSAAVFSFLTILEKPQGGVQTSPLQQGAGDWMIPTRGQNFTCFQSNVNNFKVMGGENLYQELPPMHIHTHMHTYVRTLQSKKAIFASICPNEMATVLAMYIII